MASAFVQEDSQLIADLHALSKKSPKLVKSSIYPAPADPTITVRSWRMNEFKYYDIPSPFPTLARGIFTTELSKDESGDEKSSDDDVRSKYRIVARGYDKFFNIGEVPWVTWPSLESHTAAPYTLSLKSNGCIIFIAALTPSKLLITSKHSIGPVKGSDISHAQAGETWLRKYLENKQRTEEQLAARLYKDNLTAIAELCDDSFEEHVLGYSPERTGLHLHGLNVATKAFKTLPHEEVDAFAEEWGFIKTASVTFNSIPEIRAFTTKVAKDGEWNGEAVEGFVVRTHVTEPPVSQGKSASASPYPPGSSFFFKVKFDEPYMMYRDWREMTKKLLSAKATLSESALPKAKMRRPETRVYVRWVIDEIKRNPAAFKGYLNGKGIIATRERFLEHIKSSQGSQELKNAQEASGATVDAGDKTKYYEKTIIAPVAIPGCGKTAVSVALAHIFGFAHTQSDDVLVKKPAPQFIKNVTSLLKTHDVVIADKNNHLVQHRQALRDAAKSSGFATRIIALNWAVGNVPQATVHRVCGDRITQRGANHQTLRPDEDAAHEEVIWLFLNTRQEFSANEADAVVEMEVEESMEEAVRRAVNGIVNILDLPPPSQEKIAEALQAIEAYTPTVRKPDEKKKSKSSARYYGLLVEIDLQEVLGTRLGALANAEGVEGEAASMWATLRSTGRIVKLPHVTIVHRKSLPAEKPLWNRCADLQALSQPPLFRAHLGHVVWNSHVMALTVDKLEVVGGDGGDQCIQQGEEFISRLTEELTQRLHITVATLNGGISAVEAKALVEDWREGKTTDYTGNIRSLALQDIVANGRIKAVSS